MSSVPSADLLFSGLLVQLAAILEITQRLHETASPQARHELLQAANEYKELVAQCKGYSQSLPGGDLTIKEQDVIINMLERLRDRKRELLVFFSERTLLIPEAPVHAMKIDLDSIASTPGLS